MSKKNLIVNFKKVGTDLLGRISETYPDGFEDAIKFFQMGADKSFYAFPLSTEDCNYLVKVDVDFDFSIELEDVEEASDDESDIE